MANVVGEHFFKYTDDQVKQRQKIYAKRDRTSIEDLAYMNGKTAWLKLVSSIDIDQDKYKELSLSGDLSKNRLASDLVLFGGTTPHITKDKIESIVQLRGISSTDSLLNNAAYGLGGDDFGKRPMPGIISAQVKPKNRGSLREAIVQIKAYNKGQLDLLDAIYLRIGYTMLLEWGWSNYYDNEGTYQSNPSNTLAWEFLKYNGPKPETTDVKYNDSNNKSYRVYGTGSAYWDFLEKIEKKRGSSNGNYDAMLAKVANFSWEFGNDGTYDITLKLISVGDVVESLKINIFSPITIASNSNSSDGETWTSKYFKHDIGKHLWSRINFTKLNSNTTSASPTTGATVGGSNSTEVIINLPTIWDPTNNQNNDIVISNKNAIDLNQIIYNNDFNNIKIREKSVMIYYRFGAFLKYMEDELLLYDESGRPIITIDYDTNTNLVFRTPNQISTFPNKCIVGGITYNVNGSNIILFPGCTPYPASSIYSYINYAGLLMNVYLEFDFILDTIETSTDQETGDLSIFTFLSNICNGINDSLGNYNKIELVLDEDRLYFIDQTPIPKIEKIKESIKNYGRTADLYADKPTYFNPYGIGPNGGSLGTFVKKFSIKTELTNEFATIVTVGAQANGAVVGEDATLLSKWNKGLTDRIIPVKTDFLKSNITSSSTLNETNVENIKNQYYKIVNDYLDNSLREEGNDNSYESDKKVMKAFIDYINQKNTQASGSVTTGLGFIPLNLNLTCEGISGPKIYQQFSIDTNFLPKKYPDVLRFLIRGITHNIQNNTWETTFDSLSIPEQVASYSDSNFQFYNTVTANQVKICKNYTQVQSVGLLKRANDDIIRWRKGNSTLTSFPIRGTLKETDPEAFCYLNDYWSSINIATSGWKPSTAWSSAYVTWLAITSNLPINAKYNPQSFRIDKLPINNSFQNHNHYIQIAVFNTINPNPITPSLHYKAFEPTTQPISPGDILIYNQESGNSNFSTLMDGIKGKVHGDIVIESGTNYIYTQGGNLSDTVTRYKVTTKNQKLPKNSSPYPNGPKYIMHLKIMV